MKIENLIIEYQEAFNSQNLDKLKSIFSEDITLKDWDREVKGNNNALQENKKIFESVKSIRAETVKNYFFENIAVCILKIVVNDNEILDVVDIIEVNRENKISSIKAYKG